MRAAPWVPPPDPAPRRPPSPAQVPQQVLQGGPVRRRQVTQQLPQWAHHGQGRARGLALGHLEPAPGCRLGLGLRLQTVLGQPHELVVEAEGHERLGELTAGRGSAGLRHRPRPRPPGWPTISPAALGLTWRK